MPFRSPVLDCLAGELVSLDGCAGHGQAVNCRGLASHWFPLVLALEISAGWRPAERITPEICVLNRRWAQENSDWGAPKIHGELQKLGWVLSERTVARYLRGLHRRGDPAKKWLAFLHNHREAIVALDLFTVPSATFECGPVSLSSSTSAAGSCTSTLRGIHRPIGSCSSCAKPLRRRLPIATPFWITIAIRPL